ncbi:hypothetical protein ACQKWADRAFT_192600 [Trichoderma austrokoningii]
MFYQGSLQEGISTAVGQQKLVLCFVTNENDESTTWETEYLQDAALSKLIETQAVALRLLADSDEAGYLSQIFPLPKTPTVVIMKHGELKEYIAAGTPRDDFVRRVLVAFDAAPPARASSLPSPAESPAASPTSSPTRLAARALASRSRSPSPASRAQTQIPPATAQAATQILAAPALASRSPSPSPASQAQAQIPPTAQATTQAAAQSEIVSRILAERAAKLQAQKEEAERRAKEERVKAQAGADTDGAMVHRQAEELRKKRHAEQEERRRILKRIQDDREERRMRAEAKERQRMDRQKIGDVAASLVNSAESKLPSTNKVSEMASIQVRLFDGTTIRSRFKTASPLRDVRQWVDESKGDNKSPYTFKQVLTPAPNKNIDATEEGRALGELGLVPSSTLVLIPVQNYSTAYPGEKLHDPSSSSFFSRLLRTILGFFVWILSLVGLAGGEQRREEAPSTRQRERERDGASDATARAVRGVQSLADRQRHHQLYNGNSLNFEPRPDEDES